MDAVRAAFDAIPRAEFLPPRERSRAAYDGPISLGHGSTNSQPRTVEDMLRLLSVQTGQRVLDVGAGSGWTTALLAHLTGPDGLVIGVELEPEVAAFGAANLELVQEAYSLARERPGARITWIAAHSGYRWNEYADALATAYRRQVP